MYETLRIFVERKREWQIRRSTQINQQPSAHSSNQVKQKSGWKFPNFKKKQTPLPSQEVPLSERWEKMRWDRVRWENTQKIQWERIPLEELLDRQDAELQHQLTKDQIEEYLQYQRAELLFNLVTTLGLKVINWGKSFDEIPHEAVEIIVALGSAGVITAIVNIIKTWIEKDKVDNVIITMPNGIRLDIKRATAQEIQDIVETINRLFPKGDNNEPSSEKPMP